MLVISSPVLLLVDLKSIFVHKRSRSPKGRVLWLLFPLVFIYLWEGPSWSFGSFGSSHFFFFFLFSPFTYPKNLFILWDDIWWLVLYTPTYLLMTKTNRNPLLSSVGLAGTEHSNTDPPPIVFLPFFLRENNYPGATRPDQTTIGTTNGFSQVITSAAIEWHWLLLQVIAGVSG